MQNKYYFTAGEFCAEGMGRNYIGYGAKFLIVYDDTYENAYKVAHSYANDIFGKQEYKDMWYGENAWNWKVEPHTLKGFKQLYKNRFDLICYHKNRACLMFTGKPETKENLKWVIDEFVKNHPILEIKDNKIEAFSGNIDDILDIKQEIKFPETVKESENINVTETILDKEFFE